MDKRACVYIVQCVDSTYYTGWSLDPEKRVATHNEGKGAKYTRSRLPVKLVYVRWMKNKFTAMREENRIKTLPRTYKTKLIKESGDRVV